jgi:hypothetical protein
MAAITAIAIPVTNCMDTYSVVVRNKGCKRPHDVKFVCNVEFR